MDDRYAAGVMGLIVICLTALFFRMASCVEVTNPQDRDAAIKLEKINHGCQE